MCAESVLKYRFVCLIIIIMVSGIIADRGQTLREVVSELMCIFRWFFFLFVLLNKHKGKAAIIANKL